MKFFLSGLGSWARDLSLITEAITEADQLGFDGAVMPDHYMWGEHACKGFTISQSLG